MTTKNSLEYRDKDLKILLLQFVLFTIINEYFF